MENERIIIIIITIIEWAECLSIINMPRLAFECAHIQIGTRNNEYQKKPYNCYDVFNDMELYDDA